MEIFTYLAGSNGSVITNDCEEKNDAVILKTQQLATNELNGILNHLTADTLVYCNYARECLLKKKVRRTKHETHRDIGQKGKVYVWYINQVVQNKEAQRSNKAAENSLGHMAEEKKNKQLEKMASSCKLIMRHAAYHVKHLDSLCLETLEYHKNFLNHQNL